MKLPENTNYEAFTKFLEEECMHETVYDDSEGRRILVVRVLDAFTMAHRWGVRMVRDEREACAKVCDVRRVEDGWEGFYADACAAEIRARGQE